MRSNVRIRHLVKLIGVAVFSTVLALFFLFVGFMKAFAPLTELARHRAWTVHLPVLVGRGVGWTEIICALLLLFGMFCPSIGIAGALALLLNQVGAGVVHAWVGEFQSLPQNGLIVFICGVVCYLQFRRIDRGSVAS
ncbi:MAG: DoxX family protein [Novosphingobium sp.]|nr:DoxX family protein [Novosphingobium sp.]